MADRVRAVARRPAAATGPFSAVGLVATACLLAAVGGAALAADPRPPAASPKAAAAARGELQDLRQRIEGLQKKVAGAEEVKSEAADALRESERAISDANRRLFEIAAEKKAVNEEIARLSGEAGAVESRVRAQQERLGRLLQRRYVAGDPDPLQLALSGDNPAEVARLLHYYGYLHRAYQAQIEALRAELARLATVSGERRRKGAELAALEQEAGRERGRLEVERGRHQVVLARASKEIESNRRQIATLRRDEDRLTRLVEQIARLLAERERARAREAAAREVQAKAREAREAREVAKAAREAREAERSAGAPGERPLPKAPDRQAGRSNETEGAVRSGDESPRADAGSGRGPRTERIPEPGVPAGVFASLKGRLALPVAGEIANRFGQARADGGMQWRGITILARPGQEVRAVAPGRVVFADWLRGFGNLLIVDHGDGYMTLYGNNESLLRRVGDGVRGGDPVATVGASGGSAQAGLYFELRHQGRPLDPIGWSGGR
ncbi:MAG: peptidoglycan DD-metalloendopeptidase family protein [Betaproteobacteria bacterium]|jgi:septal ring factor EnvC (AmiA/AmiB activator)|nr:peptidoglycan DD-metalloendopeptidase family protein [Betaproteobacteria bacterium]